RVAPAWLVLLAMAAGALAFILLYVLLRWAFACVGQALARSTERRLIGAMAATAAVLFLGQHLTPWVPAEPRFSVPVTQTYTQQMGLVMKAFRHSNTLAPRPDIDSDLALVNGADVLLIFVESYGAVSYERSEFADRLARSRARVEAAIRRTNRDVVSTYVESPTFGGSSWLAHISLISGVEVREADANALLMTEKRETLVTTFTRGGYRAIALMPGLRQRWPEGAFYRFDDIYSAERLAYHGPQFGWWSIPDQFSLARLDELELARQPRAPVFAFFPTISTHTPFSPTPPYQPDWRRMLSDHPYDTDDWERS